MKIELPNAPNRSASSPANSAQEYTGTVATPDHLTQLIQERVWLHVRRRKAWLATLAAPSPAPDPSKFFNDPDHPAAERAWQLEDATRPWQEAIHQLDAQLAGPAGHPLRILAETFDLTAPELDLLQACVTQQLDPALGPALTHLHGNTHAPFVSGPAVRRIFGHSSGSFCHPLSNLRRWQLVHACETTPGDPACLEADPIIVPWLEGRLMLDPSLAPLIRIVPARNPLSGWPLEEATHILEQAATHRTAVRLVLSGPPDSGRATFAATAAESLGAPSIAVDTAAISETEWPQAFLRVQRFAILGGFALIWTGEHVDRPWPRYSDAARLQIIAREPEQAVATPGWSDYHLTLRPLTIAERTAVWKDEWPAFAQWPEEVRAILTERYQLSVGQIHSIRRLEPHDGAQALNLAREVTRQDIGTLGQCLSCPFTWDDIVLPSDLVTALRDLSYEARARTEFWERDDARRLFPRGMGLTALLSGPPGTGKTMAAQVIASDLNLDLFRIDLARVVSKYIGETAKHLREIFSRAARMSAILLFDEADALFAKRTQVKDSHDRHANADTSYLLQLLEEYRGLALLTTNERGNIDPAFNRRLRYIYEFPKPGPAERLELWQRLTSALFDEESSAKLRPGLSLLAAQVSLSPAQIKATLLAAAFLARRSDSSLDMPILLTALQRELAKEGRGLDASLRSRSLANS